jgi:hypothetical protein
MEILVQHATREGRDAHINSGMELGLQEALDLMEQVAVSLSLGRDEDDDEQQS